LFRLVNKAATFCPLRSTLPGVTVASTWTGPVGVYAPPAAALPEAAGAAEEAAGAAEEAAADDAGAAADEESLDELDPPHAASVIAATAMTAAEAVAFDLFIPLHSYDRESRPSANGRRHVSPVPGS
jgi:hypothetical protein